MIMMTRSALQRIVELARPNVAGAIDEACLRNVEAVVKHGHDCDTDFLTVEARQPGERPAPVVVPFAA